MSELINILNLGAGVQSTTVALMSIHGELPKIDFAFFADTGWEPKEVYEHLDWLIPVMEQAGTQVHKVSCGNIKENTLSLLENRQKWAGSLPYFVKTRKGYGMLRRQCTHDYKIQPIRMAVKTVVFGLNKHQRWPTEVKAKSWFGISLDEYQRVRKSQEKWAENYYPLIEKRMRRHDCLDWVHKNGYKTPPRSACVGCPFHSNKEWRHLKETSPEEFEDACLFDDALRHSQRFGKQIFLHRSCKPLREVDLSRPMIGFWDDECGGVCGV